MPLLARILLENGYLKWEDLQRGTINQIISGKRLGRILVEENIITEPILNKALAIRFGVEPIPSNLLTEPVPPVKKELMEKFPVYPWEETPRFLKLAMLDPTDKKTLATISYTTGKIVKPYSIPESSLRKIYEQFKIPIPEKKFYKEETRGKINAIPEGRVRIKNARTSRKVLDYIIKTSSLILKKPEVLIIFSNRIELFNKNKIIEKQESGSINTVIESGSPYIGSPIVKAVEKELLKALNFKNTPSHIVLIPVRLKGKVVNIIFGELWKGREDALPDLISLAGDVEIKYESLLQQKWQKIKSPG